MVAYDRKCSRKNRICSYAKSRRGGPRVSRKKSLAVQSELHAPDTSGSVLASANDISDTSLQLFPEFDDLVMPMTSPGAGLKQLDSDQIFDSIFGSCSSDDNGVTSTLDRVDFHSERSSPATKIRSYACDADILNAYYIFIHPYLPILPPPERPLVPDDPMDECEDESMPSSPISLAVSTILSLIPSPQDPEPQSDVSVHLRRERAQLLAGMTLESIEIEAEILASVTSPAHALSSAPSAYNRELFHPRTPLELESTLAFLLLSIYEYAQRGNLVKMRNRASQAYDAATRLSLHEDWEGANDPMFGEARRRAWWMTYVCVLQGSIVGGTAPIIPVGFRHFSTPLPVIESDPDAWTQFLDAQYCILKCTQYTVALKKALAAGADLTAINCRMLALDEETSNLLADAPSLAGDVASLLDPQEQSLARSLRAQTHIKLNSCKIKLHRYRAFLDAPLFTRRHCDLERAEDKDRAELLQGCCSQLLQGRPVADGSTTRSWSSSSSGSDRPTSAEMVISPFDNTASAKICMKAALAIGRAFEALPYPNPTLSPDPTSSRFLSSMSFNPAPRTMPAFACCAMQGSYALLMLCHRSLAMSRGSCTNAAYHNGIEELYAGLGRILSTLQNYSIAFEALDGMRSQIQEAFQSVRALHDQSKYPSPTLV